MPDHRPSLHPNILNLMEEGIMEDGRDCNIPGPSSIITSNHLRSNGRGNNGRWKGIATYQVHRPSLHQTILHLMEGGIMEDGRDCAICQIHRPSLHQTILHLMEEGEMEDGRDCDTPGPSSIITSKHLTFYILHFTS